MINTEMMQPKWVISWISVVLINIWEVLKGWKLFICEPLIHCPIIEGQIVIYLSGGFPINIAIDHAGEYYNLPKETS